MKANPATNPRSRSIPTRLLPLLIACLGLAPLPTARAQDLAAIKQRMAQRVLDIAPLKTDKTVGENRDGFLELLRQEHANQAQPLVDAENADRRQVYRAVAERTQTTADTVGKERARQIAESSAPGVMLQREDGTWYEKR
ncbi:MAG: DUF1318 domain-containing protein [Lentisphaeria bacterium]|nr:DUF1318 domain-containing protein [Lentisphaeria bacterium]